MSFDKHYPNRKDKRKSYYGPKAVDRSCRNHGSCPYCQTSRMHKHDKREIGTIQQLNELYATDELWANGVYSSNGTLQILQ